MARLPGIKGRITEVMDQVHDKLAANDRMVEAMRLRHALDNVTTNVMIADADGIIRYMNHSISGMLANAEADIRKELANFDAKRLIGVNSTCSTRTPRISATCSASCAACTARRSRSAAGTSR